MSIHAHFHNGTGKVIPVGICLSGTDVVQGKLLAKKSPSAEDRLPKSLHFAEFDVIIGVVRARSVHEVGYGHK